MVFVLNKNKKPLNPCHPAKARWLLKNGCALVVKRHPFTIRLKQLVHNPKLKDYILKLDPGAKTTGMAITDTKGKVVFLANLEHRQNISSNLKKRRDHRRARRNRKTRYRRCKFINRYLKKDSKYKVKSQRPEGWLPPSIKSIVDNIDNWTIKLRSLCPITKIIVETVRFDTQLMENPDIQGIEYQQGTLWGYEVKEYLLYKHNHLCQYCKVKEEGSYKNLTRDTILEIEHKHSKAKGGTNRFKNLTLACSICNKDKSSLTLKEWLESLKKQPTTKLNKTRIENIEAILKGEEVAFYKDVAKVNSSRKAVYRTLAKHTKDLEVVSGGRTKFNRSQLNLPKTHYYDALATGIEIPESIKLHNGIKVLNIKAVGRGSRNRTNLDKYGFPRSYLPRQKQFFGYQTGDYVKAVVPKGKNKGVWFGKVAIRSTGSFKITLADGTKKDGINYKYCTLLQRADGYNYGEENPA